MHFSRIVAAAVGAALLYGATVPLQAGGGTVPFEDTKRGFTTRVPDSFKQNPPKPNGQSKWEASSFYDDQAKYKSSGSQNPQFVIGWWSTPKTATTPGAPAPDAPPKPDKPMTMQDAMDEYGAQSIEDVVDGEIDRNTKLFGSNKPSMADRWATGKTGKTTKQKIDFKYVDINPVKSKKKDGPQPIWYLFVAKLTIERPTETVIVSFHGYCAIEFADKLGPAFLDVVKNFETHDTGNGPVVRDEAPTDPDKYRDWLKKKKLVPGWKCVDSPKKQYVVFYDESVNDKLVKDIAEQVESLRGQVYEQVFPPDRPITAISVIRVCKDLQQYQAYGTPSGSAGVWMALQGELVFYEDTSNKKDSLRVLYHEAFHQYIFYSCGAVSPPSWFNEGHGDFFYGHNFKDGKWELGKSLERIGDAAKAKRDKRVPPLKEWLRWEQDRYYVRTPGPLTIYENYALGWDFVYFLRTSKKPEYQGILDRYFTTLKGLCSKAHDEREAARAKLKAEGHDPGPETAEEEMLANDRYEQDWHDKAYEAAFKGVDLEALNKEWLATIQ